MVWVDITCYVTIVPPLVKTAIGQTASHTGGAFILSVTITIFNVPLTSVTWTHEGNILTGNEARVSINTSTMLPTTSGPVMSTLQIIAVEGEDAGIYTAIASYHSHNTTVQFDTKVSGGLRNVAYHPE